MSNVTKQDNGGRCSPAASRSPRYLRAVALAVIIGLLAVSCSVAVDELDVVMEQRGTVTSAAPAVVAPPDTAAGLPAIGPIPAASHWHAAYVVRVCDDVLPPFESTDDPLGIHSHADGLMHVHPFYEESGYEAATLKLFGDAMGFTLTDGELTLPGGGTWRDGDLCNGVPGRVFVDRWQLPDPESPVERIFDGLETLRYEADGELYQIAFAPADSFPVVPPAFALLPEVSNLGEPPEPWVEVAPVAGGEDVSFWQVRAVDSEPCSGSAVPERVLFGPVRCFEPGDFTLAASEAVERARVVLFNREPAIEIEMAADLRRLFDEHFANAGNPLVLAIEVDGFVVTAPQVPRAPLGNRLVVSGGLTVDAAERLVELLNQ